MKIIIVLLQLIIFSNRLFADASPKLNPRIDVEILNDNNTIEFFDSVVVIVKYQSDQYRDTLTTYTKTDVWWDKGGVDNYSNGKININFRRKVDFFKLILIKEGELFESEYIYPIGSWSFLEFKLKNNLLIPNNNLFFTRWTDYFISLMLTVSIELLFLFIIKALRFNFKSVSFVVILVNLITHPLLWYVYTNNDVSIIPLEFIVMFIETLFVSFYLRSKIEPLNSSISIIMANFFSWILGGVIFWVITQ